MHPSIVPATTSGITYQKTNYESSVEMYGEKTVTEIAANGIVFNSAGEAFKGTPRNFRYITVDELKQQREDLATKEVNVPLHLIYRLEEQIYFEERLKSLREENLRLAKAANLF